jgi:hypothetical protein
MPLVDRVQSFEQQNNHRNGFAAVHCVLEAECGS